MNTINKDNLNEKVTNVKQVIINKRGFSFFSLLTLLLIALKFTIRPDISWFWIIASFFGPLILLGLFVLTAIVVVFSCAIIVTLYEYWEDRFERKRIKQNREKIMRKRNETNQ